MNKSNKTLIIVLSIIGIIFLSFIGSYNGLVSKQEAANEAFGNVQSTYQRREDLIPALVETVKGYAKHEKETLEEVVKLRSGDYDIMSNEEKISNAAGGALPVNRNDVGPDSHQRNCLRGQWRTVHWCHCDDT